MLKYQCDICKKEFEPYKANGQRLFSNFNYYLKKINLIEKQSVPQLDVKSYMLCNDCGDKLNKEVDKIKKNNEAKDNK